MKTKSIATLVFIAFITLSASCISSGKTDSVICEKLTSSQSLEQALKDMGIGFMKIPSILTDTNPVERYETQWIETISFNDVVQGLLFGVASEEKKYHKYVIDVYDGFYEIKGFYKIKNNKDFFDYSPDEVFPIQTGTKSHSKLEEFATELQKHLSE